MTILGGLDDQTALLVWGNISKCFVSGCSSDLSSFFIYRELFLSLTHPLLSNQPILSLIISLSLRYLGGGFLNYLFIFTLLLNFFSAWLLFKRFKYHYVYSLIYTFSSYMWSHFAIHIDLSQTWVFPAFIYLLLEFKNKFTVKNSFYISVFFTLVILISNYNGFLLLLFFACFSISGLLVRPCPNGLAFLRFTLLTFLITFFLIFVTLFPFIRANYLVKSNPSDFRYLVHRPFEDFIAFSSRPWYFFTPSVKNPILGTYSKKILASMATKNYFLSDDYFYTEHSGNYFGLLLLATTFISVIYVLKKSLKRIDKLIWQYILTIFLLVSFMMPAFFTLSGNKFYTPGIILYKFFPMFRVTSRVSIVVLLILLLVLSYCIDYIYSNGPGKLKKFLPVFMVVLTIVTLSETYMPLKITKIPKPSESYIYMRQDKPSKTIFAVYPYSRSQEALYYLSVHQQFLLNPKGYVNPSFDSAEFTKKLITSDGLQKFKNMGGSYLVVFKNADIHDVQFFKSSNSLFLEKEFPDSYVFKLNIP